ncbi:MAG: hypothetical protein HKN71_07205 [Gemmatimonadetes bacterium]|nr:hypothetical protein [Gemmatimonadota bacterium]
MMRIRSAARAIAVLGAMPASPLVAQDAGSWSRGEPATAPPPVVFHSTMAANLPTAETLSKGELIFEISHRFEPAIAEAEDALFGLDGPVYLRLGLGYAVSNRTLVTLTRSNLNDNYDLNLKVRVIERAGRVPWMLAFAGGWAYNAERPDGVDRATQWYGEAILNAGLGERLGVGFVPWVLHNPDLEAENPETTAGVGGYLQAYLTPQVSVLGEWNATEGFSDFTHDAGTLALQLETGGHFFTLMVTNSIRPNPSQFLAGADVAFEPGEWRFGFNVTRLLVF